MTGPMVEGVVAELRRKYGFAATPADIEAGEVWFFALAPRAGVAGGMP